MAEIYEIVIFTAAMQDVSTIFKCLIYMYDLVCGLGIELDRQGKTYYIQTL